MLFGSYAYGQPHDESDVDLLIVVPDPPSVHEAWEVAREISEHTGVPVQLWFMSPDEFEETRDVVGGLAFPAHNWGKVLYEAHP
jgi:predicted nucleotidyltransferase